MSRLSLRALWPGDVTAFTPRADFAEEMGLNRWRFECGGQPPGASWTLMRGDQVVGVGGLFDQGSGVFDAWAWLADLSPREWPDAVRFAASCLRFIETSKVVVLIRADARLDHPAAIRLLRRLGFVRAGVRHVDGRAYQHMHRSR